MCLVTPRTRHLSAMHATATEGANSLRWLCTPTSTACKLAATRVISSSALWWHRMNNNFWTHSSLGRLSSVRAGGWGSRANWGDLGSSTAAYLPPAGERAHRVDGRRQLQHRDCWVGWYRHRRHGEGARHEKATAVHGTSKPWHHVVIVAPSRVRSQGHTTHRDSDHSVV